MRILSALAEREFNVSQLALEVGISELGISHHMRGLRQMRIVQSRRDGKEVFYRIEDEHIIALFQQGVNHKKWLIHTFSRLEIFFLFFAYS